MPATACRMSHTYCLSLFACILGGCVVACAAEDDASPAELSGSKSISSTSDLTGTGGTSTTGQTGAGGSAEGGDTTTSTDVATSTNAICSTEEDRFSFFLASYAALTADSGSTSGYGGGLGGLLGADGICQRIAEKSAPCHRGKVIWHAFLSTSTVNARDRIGSGPWYDRRGRLLARNLTNLLTVRPTGADSTIVNDLPNENGTPNHNPDGTGQVDNHEILTGTGIDGYVYTQSGTVAFPGGATSCGPRNEETWSKEAATCWGWTTKEPKGCPRVGHSWPRDMSGNNWMSVWNEGGCAPGGTLSESGGLDGTRRVGSAGGYGGFYCFAVTGK